MRPLRLAPFVVMFMLLALLTIRTRPVAAQQTTIGAPMQGLGDGFFENIGGGASLGFGFKFPGGNGFMNASAAQGSSRSLSSMAPSVTVVNGGQAFFADVTQQPFVIGFVPVVGWAPVVGGQFGVGQPNAMTSPPGPSVLEDRLSRIREAGGFKFGAGGSSPTENAATIHDDRPAKSPAASDVSVVNRSSAEQPTASIAQIRQEQNEATEAATREVQSLLEQGRQAQAAGKPKVAKIYYQQALRRASGEVKDQVQEALRSLGDSKSSR